MGQYTEHWAKYTRESNQRTLGFLGILLRLPLIALVHSGLTVMVAVREYGRPGGSWARVPADGFAAPETIR